MENHTDDLSGACSFYRKTSTCLARMVSIVLAQNKDLTEEQLGTAPLMYGNRSSTKVYREQ